MGGGSGPCPAATCEQQWQTASLQPGDRTLPGRSEMPPNAAPSLSSKEQIPPRGWLRALGPGAGGVWVLLGAAGSAWAPPAPPALQREPVPTAAASWCVMLAHEMQAGAAVYQPKCSPNRGAINSWARSLGRGKQALCGQILCWQLPVLSRGIPQLQEGTCASETTGVRRVGGSVVPVLDPSALSSSVSATVSRALCCLPWLHTHFPLPREHLLLLLRPGGCLRGWLSS